MNPISQNSKKPKDIVEEILQGCSTSLLSNQPLYSIPENTVPIMLSKPEFEDFSLSESDSDILFAPRNSPDPHTWASRIFEVVKKMLNVAWR